MFKNPIIKEIWIVNSSGITLYNQSVNITNDPKKKILLGSFLSSINTMAKSIKMGEFQNIVVGDDRISFLHYKSELMFVCQSDIRTKETKVLNYVEKLKNKFINNFSEKLDNWNGDISLFEDMDKYINLSTDSENILGIELDSKKSKDILSKL